MDESLPFPWNTFSELQRATDTSVVSHARDEALSELLDDFADGSVPRDSEAMLRRYRSLVTNRAKKYRSRRQVARQVEHHERRRLERHDAFERAADREIATVALRAIDEDDRQLFSEIFIRGWSYEEAAKSRRRPIGTIKARISRLRKQMRDDCTRRGVVRRAA